MPFERMQGNRVGLDLSKLESYRLFPGQVIAAQGVNPAGQSFTATKIITFARLPSLGRPHHHNQGNLVLG